MPKFKNRFFPVKPLHLQIIGILLVLLLAGALLWYGEAHSLQAVPAMMAQVRFEGEYRIADGPWQEIVEGQHIPSTKGDVTLRGNFHMYAPDGEYVDIYSGEIPIAFYADHISISVCIGDSEPHVMDIENPLFGASGCGVSWTAYSFWEEYRDPIEIRFHNPHSFGNETAIDKFLANTAFWANIDFEKGVLESSEPQRNTGLFFMIVSLALLGIALFSALIHIQRSKTLCLFGLVILFAGTYMTYCADSIAFWSDSVVSNTTILGCSMMFYFLFLSMAMVHLMNVTKSIGIVTVVVLGCVDALFLALPMVANVMFFDTWLYWVVVQGLANSILFFCLIHEFCTSKEKGRWLYLSFLTPLIAFCVDAVATALGLWQGGLASQYVFFVFSVGALVAVLKIIPQSINALAKAKELETEKLVLNAQLTESRVSTMMSQIRPHFIYNTLGSIEQLCILDPAKAGELVHNFAKYLRGNFGELDNPRPILMSQEMEHVHHYISIENVRFPDMTFSFEMNSDDFHIPALTIQPIVENAIKHGLMKLPKGGKIRVASFETDTHYCVLVEDDGVGFDTGVLLDERKHVGIRNIRGRLKAMVNGSLEIESTVGVGTKVQITIPKEVGV